MKNPVAMRRLGRLLFCLILVLLPAVTAQAAAPVTTTIADTVYRADGTPAAGTLVISWPAFTTADGKAVPAGRKTVKIGAAGAVSIPLAPNFGASPEGTYYKVTYKLDDGSTSDEFWSVPAAPATTISAIRSKLAPANVAVQYATRQYVDSMLAQGGTSGNAVKIQGKDVDVAEPVRGQSLTFDGTKYVPQSHPIVDVVRDCGARGDGITDDGPALQACLTTHPGKTIFFPKSRAYGSTPDYYVGTAAFANSSGNFGLVMSGVGQTMMGDAGAFSGGSGVTIQFAAGLVGVTCVNTGGTTYGGFPGIQSAQGCRIANINLQGSEPYDSALHAILPAAGNTAADYGPATGTSTADGVRLAANFAGMEHVMVKDFGRHGVYMDGHSTAPDHAFADDLSLRNVSSYGNRGSGFYNRGADSNASVFIGLAAYSNQLFGFEDYSFLGVQWNSPQASSNHRDYTSGVQAFPVSGISNQNNVTTVTTSSNHNLSPGMAVALSGTTRYNGTWFVASTPAPNQFTFSQTSPVASENAGTVTNATSAQVWAAAGHDANIGGAYRATGSAVNSVWLNPYSESDNGGICRFDFRNIIIGGDFGCTLDWTQDVNWIHADTHGFQLPPAAIYNHDANGNKLDVGIGLGVAGPGANPAPALRLFNSNAFAAPTATKGSVYLGMDATSASGAWYLFTNGTGLTSGQLNAPLGWEYASTSGTDGGANPKAIFPNGLLFGGSSNINSHRLWFGNSNASANIPNWFQQYQGSLAINNGAAAGGFGAWICVASGDPCGSWRAAMPLANDATGTSWTMPQLNLTTLQMSGQVVSSVATGTAPLVVASTTPVANLTLASDAQLPTISSPGKIATAAVTGIQGRSVSSSAPNDGDCYKWVASASEWRPASCAGTGASAHGSSNYVQVNNAGTFGSDSGFQWDLTNHRLGILANGAVDAPVKVGTNAAAGFVGVGPLISMAYSVNDTNFPSVRYPMGMVDANDVSVTNGGANNTIYGSWFSQLNAHGAGISKIEPFVSQGEVTGASTVATWYDFSAAPTVGSGSTISARHAFHCDAHLGSGAVSSEVCFSANGSIRGYTQDGTGVNYLRGKLAVNYQGDPTHQLDVGGTAHYAIDNQKLTYYNQVATGGEGQAYEVATPVNLTAQGADITVATLKATGTAPGAGMYRALVYAIVTRAATTSSILPTACIIWTDPDNATIQTMNFNAVTPSGNSLTTMISGQAVIYAAASTNIQYATGANCAGGTTYGSSGGTSMQYALHIRLERIN